MFLLSIKCPTVSLTAPIEVKEKKIMWLSSVLTYKSRNTYWKKVNDNMLNVIVMFQYRYIFSVLG